MMARLYVVEIQEWNDVYKFWEEKEVHFCESLDEAMNLSYEYHQLNKSNLVRTEYTGTYDSGISA